MCRKYENTLLYTLSASPWLFYQSTSREYQHNMEIYHLAPACRSHYQKEKQRLYSFIGISTHSFEAFKRGTNILYTPAYTVR